MPGLSALEVLPRAKANQSEPAFTSLLDEDVIRRFEPLVFLLSYELRSPPLGSSRPGRWVASRKQLLGGNRACARLESGELVCWGDALDWGTTVAAAAARACAAGLDRSWGHNPLASWCSERRTLEIPSQ
jgi:hypothetical protein